MPREMKSPARNTLRRPLAHRRGERGVAMVEMAIVLPVFVFILFAVIELGRGVNYWIDETHLANEGARWLVVNKDLGCGGTNCLQTYLPAQADAADLQSAMSVSWTFPNGTCNVGDPATVTVTYLKNWLPFLNLAPTHITGSATMRIEAKPTNYTGCT
jgi:Flp pilus assembly protein TadG